MDFTVDFFRDEVRNGFYVPTAIKQSWAASITVLSEIDRICQKYDITYFADWGTILGAVRHGGFVPWDDDLDICMKRDDYIKFREVADKELPEEFVIHDYERKDNHWLFLSRVVNNSKVCFKRKYMEKYHNFPYMCAVDIFIQDYLYKDIDKERERCSEVKRLIAVADGIVGGRLGKEAVENELSAFEKKYNIGIDREIDPQKMGVVLYKLAEEQMARVREKDAERVGQIFPWILKGDLGLPKEYYEKVVRLPFENITVPVPSCYNEVLKSRYGNYLQIHKVWGGHDYPYFEKQRESMENMSHSGIKGFAYTDDMIRNYKSNKDIMKLLGLYKSITYEKNKDCSSFDKDSFKYTLMECVDQLTEMTEKLIYVTKDYNYNKASVLLPECQQLAVDMGTFIEEIKGAEKQHTLSVVNSIQQYCDSLFAVYQDIICENDYQKDTVKQKQLPEGKLTELEKNMDNLKASVMKHVIERQEVLFLSIGPKEWGGFSEIYNIIYETEEYDISVIPLPLMFKDSLGRINLNKEDIASYVDINAYPDELPILEWYNYDIRLHHPEIVFIQNPYDGENPCITVPQQYYAQNIRDYTEQLIFVPAFEVSEFNDNDYNDLYNMKHYVTAPGVMYADIIIVQSENMRNQYIKKLSEFSGESTKATWENKVIIREIKNDNNLLLNEHDKKIKKILYCIGLNEISEHKDNIIESIRKRFDIFQENQGNINVSVSFYPIDSKQWKMIDEELAGTLFEMVSQYETNDWVNVIEMNTYDFFDIVSTHDAYYGSASPLIPLFVNEKKPVMVSDYQI